MQTTDSLHHIIPSDRYKPFYIAASIGVMVTALVLMATLPDTGKPKCYNKQGQECKCPKQVVTITTKNR